MKMNSCLTEHVSSSPRDTEDFGKRLASRLEPGSVIALSGGLGAGKTCLVKGIAAALGVSETITSPTYTIINEYSIADWLEAYRLKDCSLYHIDAYRLNGDEDFASTGAGDCFSAGGITIIEWSERIPNSIPPNAINIEIEISGPQSRIFRLRGLSL
jgi:tRNA threonylcarbamoyladenosine biosynthesis protein TsaE